MSRFKYQEVKAKSLNFYLVTAVWISNPNVVSVQQTQLNWPCHSTTFGADYIFTAQAQFTINPDVTHECLVNPAFLKLLK